SLIAATVWPNTICLSPHFGHATATVSLVFAGSISVMACTLTPHLHRQVTMLCMYPSVQKQGPGKQRRGRWVVAATRSSKVRECESGCGFSIECESKRNCDRRAPAKRDSSTCQSSTEHHEFPAGHSRDPERPEPTPGIASARGSRFHRL